MNSPKCEDTRLPMEGGRSCGASSDTLDFQTFQFDSIENYGLKGLITQLYSRTENYVGWASPELMKNVLLVLVQWKDP